MKHKSNPFLKLNKVEREVHKLENAYLKVEDKLGSPYRKYDETIVTNNLRVIAFFKEVIEKIKAIKDPKEISQEVWDRLEDDNFHSLCLAIEIAQGKTTIVDNLYRYDRRNEIY